MVGAVTSQVTYTWLAIRKQGGVLRARGISQLKRAEQERPQALYEEEDTLPPWPVQLVWTNCPGLAKSS